VKVRYVFMGSPLFAATILETLCEKSHPPEAVITPLAKPAGRGQKLLSSEVEYYAKNEGLTVLETGDVNNPATISALRTFDPDIVLVAAFGQLFKEEILSLPKLFCLNVHGSLLPKYRGAAPVQYAIMNGEKTTGISLQKMVKKLDAGDVLLQRQLPIESDDTSDTLMKRLAHLGGDACVEALKLIESGNYSFSPQKEAEVTFAPKIEKQQAQIQWNQPAHKIECLVRAFQPWPVAETKIGGTRLRIFKAKAIECDKNCEPGTLLSDASTYLWVKCQQGALSLTEVQLENKKRLEIKEFLLGFRLQSHKKTDGND
jgi:methionyl-tRNA formyltransferase